MIVTLNIINAVSAEIISGFVVDGDTGNRLSQVNLLTIALRYPVVDIFLDIYGIAFCADHPYQFSDPGYRLEAH